MRRMARISVWAPTHPPVLLLILLAVLPLVIPAVDVRGAEETATLTVLANNNDGRERSDGNVNLGGSGQPVGTNSGTLLAFRFQGVNIPQGATVTSAVLRLACHADGNRGADGKFSIDFQAENSGNSAALAAADFNFSTRARVTGPNWKPAAWVNGQYYDSPNIGGIIGQVVARADWAAGNALTVFIARSSDSTEYRTVGQKDGGYFTQLTFAWTTSPPPSPTPSPERLHKNWTGG